jgi:hypothetical protein
MFQTVELNGITVGVQLMENSQALMAQVQQEPPQNKMFGMRLNKSPAGV